MQSASSRRRLHAIAATFCCLAFAALAADAPAPTGGRFLFSPDFPKYATADIEFRDPTEAKWPNFIYGKPLGGELTVDLAKPAASFGLRCDKLAQKKGDQSRRVLGDLLKPDQDLTATFTATGLSGLQQDAKKRENFTGRLTGSLDLAGRKVTVQGPVTLRLHDGKKGDEKNASVQGEAVFEVKAGELGLKSADSPVKVRVSFNAYPTAAARAPVKK